MKLPFFGRSTPRSALPAERDPPEVLPCDWTAVGNALRTVLGHPPFQGKPRYPTVEEIEDWERFLPGMAARLRTQARKEAAHRQWKARFYTLHHP